MFVLLHKAKEPDGFVIEHRFYGPTAEAVYARYTRYKSSDAFLRACHDKQRTFEIPGLKITMAIHELREGEAPTA